MKLVTHSPEKELEKMLEEAGRFHGHLGPFLALGVMAGLRALEALGCDRLRMKASVRLKMEKPYSCFLDGVQYASGCTLGKGNIKVEDGEGITAVFELNDRVLKLRVRSEVLKMALEGGLEEAARSIVRRRADELFDEEGG